MGGGLVKLIHTGCSAVYRVVLFVSIPGLRQLRRPHPGRKSLERAKLGQKVLDSPNTGPDNLVVGIYTLVAKVAADFLGRQSLEI